MIPRSSGGGKKHVSHNGDNPFEKEGLTFRRSIYDQNTFHNILTPPFLTITQTRPNISCPPPAAYHTAPRMSLPACSSTNTLHTGFTW